MAKEGRIDRDDFKVLATTEPIPYCTFGATQRAPPELSKRFRQALLDLKETDTVSLNGEVIKVQERAAIDGYAPALDADFDAEREMAKRTNMPPYQRL
jgi:phosphonate transport system substrate-binding protein